MRAPSFSHYYLKFFCFESQQNSAFREKFFYINKEKNVQRE